MVACMKGLLIRNTNTYKLMTYGSYLIAFSIFVIPCLFGFFVLSIFFLFYISLFIDIFKDELEEDLKPVSLLRVLLFELPFIILCVGNVVVLLWGFVKETNGMMNLLSILGLVATIFAVGIWFNKYYKRQKELENDTIL